MSSSRVRLAAVAVALGLLTVPACSGASAGSGGHSHSGASDDGHRTAAHGSNTVRIESFRFSPKTITVKAGTVVTWTNADAAAHSVKAADGSFDSGEFGKGKSYSHTFSKPGSYPYICGVHQYMTGTVRVT